MKTTSQPTDSKLTVAQLELMNLFWERGELSVAQAWTLLSKKRSLARNTVQTMLTRMADKGWLHTRTEGKAFYFRAARPRESTLRKMVSQLLDTAFAGSASGLVMALLESRRISPEETQAIRDLIDGMQGAKR